MELALMTWPKVEKYLTENSAIMIPIGSTEQHGPMGLIGTDAITAEVIARKAAKQCQVVLGPSISVGMALHHTEFPGTISLRPSTLIAYLSDYVISLARNGFKKFYFVNGHGGNIPTCQAAFSEIYERASTDPRIGQDLSCKLHSWFCSPDISALAKELYGEYEGYHATPSEVSVTWHAYPEVVKDVEYPIPEPIKHPEIGSSVDFRKKFPSGVMGANSRLASPEDGERFIDLASQEVAKSFKGFI
ncbi:MAG: creatininase family protein [Oligoflexales bacterium]